MCCKTADVEKTLKKLVVFKQIIHYTKKSKQSGIVCGFRKEKKIREKCIKTKLIANAGQLDSVISQSIKSASSDFKIVRVKRGVQTRSYMSDWWSLLIWPDALFRIYPIDRWKMYERTYSRVQHGTCSRVKCLFINGSKIYNCSAGRYSDYAWNLKLYLFYSWADDLYS